MVNAMAEDGGWKPERIDAAFDELRDELGRVPTHVEFGKKYPAALSAIMAGKYSDDVKSFGDYLGHRGEIKPRNYWSNPDNVDAAFDDLSEQLKARNKRKTDPEISE